MKLSEEAIEKALTEQRSMAERQKLLKLLWKLSQQRKAALSADASAPQPKPEKASSTSHT